MKRLCIVSLVLLTLVSVATAQFKYTEVTCPNLKVAFLSGINNSGVMVGAYFTATDPTWHALMIRKGKCIPLAPDTVLGQKASIGESLNERGDVVGTYFDGAAWSYPAHGFLLDKKGVLQTIDFPTSDATYPWGINESGTVVGEWDIADANGAALSIHGFVWKDGAYSDVMVPGSGFTFIQGINARGEYTGYWGTDLNILLRHGFVYSHGQYVSFDVSLAGAVATIAEGINDKSHVVGAYAGDDWLNRGFVKVGAQFTPIDYPGAVMTNLNGINNAGQMVGWYYDADWALHALLVEKEK